MTRNEQKLEKEIIAKTIEIATRDKKEDRANCNANSILTKELNKITKDYMHNKTIDAIDNEICCFRSKTLSIEDYQKSKAYGMHATVADRMFAKYEIEMINKRVIS